MLDIANVLTKNFTIFKGKITGFDKDYKIIVTTEDLDESQLPCYFLRSMSGPLPEYNIGDLVLFITDTEQKTGYILGLIELFAEPGQTREDKNNTFKYPDDKIEVELPGKLEKVLINGKKIFIEADDEIQLQCGKGKIIIN